MVLSPVGQKFINFYLAPRIVSLLYTSASCSCLCPLCTKIPKSSSLAFQLMCPDCRPWPMIIATCTAQTRSNTTLVISNTRCPPKELRQLNAIWKGDGYLSGSAAKYLNPSRVNSFRRRWELQPRKETTRFDVWGAIRQARECREGWWAERAKTRRKIGRQGGALSLHFIENRTDLHYSCQCRVVN